MRAITSFTDSLLCREPFEDFEPFWFIFIMNSFRTEQLLTVKRPDRYSKESPTSMLSLVLDVVLTPPFQLGIGVKVHKSAIVVTGYKFDDLEASASKAAG